jgi:cobalamin biosynthesis protein CobT
VIPRRTRTASVSVGWEDEDGNAFTVECSVSPGQPERGPSYSSGGEPAEAPEVEILRVIEDDTGKERPDLVGVIEEGWRDEIEEQAIENAEDRHVAAYEDACERRAEEAREERWGR